MGEDRPCFVVTNGAWTVDAFPHAFWPVLWIVHSSEGRAVWAVGRRHAIRRARKIASRRLFSSALTDGSAAESDGGLADA